MTPGIVETRRRGQGTERTRDVRQRRKARALLQDMIERHRSRTDGSFPLFVETSNVGNSRKTCYKVGRQDTVGSGHRISLQNKQNLSKLLTSTPRQKGRGSDYATNVECQVEMRPSCIRWSQECFSLPRRALSHRCLSIQLPSVFTRSHRPAPSK